MHQNKQIYQVSELVTEMQRLMESSYPEVLIEGEISSLSTPASGHIYFTLKDEHSQLRCAMFRNRVSINRYLAKTGDLVRVRARVSVYTARGELQCIVQHIEAAGEGLLQRRFEELKRSLNQQGLFNAEHKLPLPDFPRRIGLITSPTGAAVTDILNTLKRRCPAIPVTLYPAVVQGEGAAKTLIQAISDASHHQQCDVIILSRGGGSQEDLWCFNDEALANAIYQCPIPIVSAVGHEIDTCIADYVADLRAPTPTAAAELLSPDNSHLQKQLASLWQRMLNGGRRYFENQAQRVDLSFQQLQHPIVSIKANQKLLKYTSARLLSGIQSEIRIHKVGVKQCLQRLRGQSVNRQVGARTIDVRALSLRLLRVQNQSLKTAKQQFEAHASQLHLVSPLATLERGFSITRDENEAIVRDSRSTNSGDTLKVQLKSGNLLCEVQVVLN